MSLDSLVESSEGSGLDFTAYVERESLSLPDMATGFMFANVPTAIESGFAMPTRDDIQQLALIDAPRQTDDDYFSTAHSTTEESDWDGWNKTLDFGRVLNYHNFWLDRRPKSVRSREFCKTVIPFPVPRMWTVHVQPFYQPGELEETRCKFVLSCSVLWTIYDSEQTLTLRFTQPSTYLSGHFPRSHFGLALDGCREQDARKIHGGRLCL